MPEMDGVEVCREARKHPSQHKSAYIILLTSRGSKEDIVQGLEAGADDYVTKPFDHGELRARVQVGSRVISAPDRPGRSRQRNSKKPSPTSNNSKGLLPICCYCKKIRDDGNYWHRVESYITGHANVRFSHGICPGLHREDES